MMHKTLGIVVEPSIVALMIDGEIIEHEFPSLVAKVGDLIIVELRSSTHQCSCVDDLLTYFEVREGDKGSKSEDWDSLDDFGPAKKITLGDLQF